MKIVTLKNLTYSEGVVKQITLQYLTMSTKSIYPTNCCFCEIIMSWLHEMGKHLDAYDG